MPAIGDKYVLTLFSYEGSALSNPLINVFAYEAVSGTPSALDLFGAFNATIIPALTPLLASPTNISNAQIINLDDPTDFTVQPIGATGGVVSQYLPRFNGWEVQYQRASRAVHNGRKTFGLVPEPYSTDGVIDASAVAIMTTLTDALEATITDSPPLGEYAPRIWRRAGTYSGTPFPDTFYPILGVAYRRISTQNSRKA